MNYHDASSSVVLNFVTKNAYSFALLTDVNICQQTVCAFNYKFKTFTKLCLPRISPLGVFFLVAAKVLEIESFADLVGRLGLYFITVLLGLFLHGFGTLTILYFIGVRKFPFKVIAQLSQVLVTAFGTASR